MTVQPRNIGQKWNIHIQVWCRLAEADTIVEAYQIAAYAVDPKQQAPWHTLFFIIRRRSRSSHLRRTGVRQSDLRHACLFPSAPSQFLSHAKAREIFSHSSFFREEQILPRGLQVVLGQMLLGPRKQSLTDLLHQGGLPAVTLEFRAVNQAVSLFEAP